MAGLFDLLSFLKQKQDQDIAGNLLGAEPEAVPGAGEGLSPMSSQALQNYGQDWARFGKGMATGAIGMPGDLVSLGRGLFSAMTPQPQQTRLDALLMGMQKPTLLPTSQDVSKAVDPYLPQFMAGESAPQTIGEIAAPAGLIGKVAKEAAPLVAKGIEALPKDLPVGASVKPVVNAPVSDIGMYSALEEAGLNLQRNKGPGQAFLNDLLKAPNVKQEEVRWIGLDDYLKDKPNATKQDVQDFIQNNRVDVQEVQLGDVKPAAVSTENITGSFDEALTPNGDEARNIFEFSFTEKNAIEPTNFTAYETRGGTVELYDNRGNFIDEYGTLEGARNHVWNESQFAATQAEGRTKFGQYTLPGGDNYREILLTMPAKKRKNATEIAQDYGYGPNDPLPPAIRDKIIAETNLSELEPTYRSGHWDQPNVLAHLRVNDRVDADGKKMLLVEEVQSDWHQAGRDKGYDTPESRQAEQQKLNDLVQERQRLLDEQKRIEELAKPYTSEGKDAPSNLIDQWSIVSNRLNANQTEQNRLGRTFKQGVPDAPFKDNWYQLALKRAIKYAADNGYDRIGLTTGSRQVDRFTDSLRANVDSIRYEPFEQDGKILYDIVGVKNGKDVIELYELSKSDLVKNLGKDIAEKISSNQGKSLKTDYPLRPDTMEISGENLTVGGEGMKKYYDEIYPQFLSKYGKKWGAKVGETSINANGKEPVRYIDITPEMKESVKKGQPLFAAVPALPVGSGLMDQMGEKKKTKAKNPRSLMESF